MLLDGWNDFRPMHKYFFVCIRHSEHQWHRANDHHLLLWWGILNDQRLCERSAVEVYLQREHRLHHDPPGYALRPSIGIWTDTIGVA